MARPGSIHSVPAAGDATLVAQRDALAESERRFRLCLDQAPIGMAIVELDGRFQFVNPALCAITGYTAQELETCTFQDITHPDDLDADLEQVANLLAGRIDAYSMDKRYLHRDGSTVWAHLSVALLRDEQGRPQHFISQIQDVSDAHAMRAQLTELALNDQLTGLANRTLILDRIQHALDGSGRKDGSVALLYCDLDRFKVVNDSLGHQIGDDTLRAVARRLTDAVRRGDTVGRLSGDEFVVLCEDVADAKVPLQLAERITDALAQPLSVGGFEVVVTASIGVAVSEDGGDTALDLLRDADMAMYQAKQRGRNRFELFDLGLRGAAEQRLVIERELRDALGDATVYPAYQPIVDLHTRQLAGVEALVRWDHPQRGTLLPAAFLGVANETGLIAQVGRIVLDQACADLAPQVAAIDTDRFRLAVNVSAYQVGRAEVCRAVERALEASGLPAANLQLELTETALLDAGRATMDDLRATVDLGVTLAIDDFGTGFSSLTLLHRLPITTLKVDQRFVAALTEDDSCRRIVASTIALGHSLGLEVVAEGVDDDRHATLLHDMGCDLAQGFLWSAARRSITAALAAVT